MEARPDASICNFFRKVCHVGPSVGHPWHRRTRYGDLGDFRCSEHRLDDAGGGAALDAMRAGVFGMHRRGSDWLPSCLALGGRIVVNVAVTNGCDRPPEVVIIFGIQNCEDRISSPT